MLEHQRFEEMAIDQVSLEIDVPGDAKNVVLVVRATPKPGNKPSGVLMRVIFADHLGNAGEPNNRLNKSPKVGTFFYLQADGDLRENDNKAGEPLLTMLTSDIPAETKTIRMEGMQWAKGNDAVIHDIWAYFISDDGIEEDVNQLPEGVAAQIPQWARYPRRQRSSNQTALEPGNTPSNREWGIDKEILPLPRGFQEIRNSYRHPAHKPASTFKVAMICDEFTYNSFSPEFDSLIVDPETWEMQFDSFGPDILFCESTWSGVDPERQPWKGKIYGSVKFSYENRSTLFSILSYCKKKGIPTVFWNKEDPTHHHDRVNDFVSTSARFDYVFTTAEECVDNYQKFKEPDRVGVLPFAAQPRLFNPVETEPRSEEAVFAGSWYMVHQKRNEKMRQGFSYVLDSNIPLVIYDRDFGTENPARQYPSEYRSLLRPAIPHSRTAGVYRQGHFGLNFNTVSDSSTMFSRRIFELAASGIQIISDYSPGVEKIYGDDVIYFDCSDAALGDFKLSQLRDNTMSAFKKTMEAHTYRHRFESILDLLKIPYSSGRPQPTMVSFISSREDADSAVELFRNHRSEFSRLLLAVSENVPTHDAGALLTDYSSGFVDVVIVSLVRKESIPSTNYLSTPEAILVDLEQGITSSALDTVMLHGEYTDQPIRACGASGQAPKWSAGPVRGGTRFTAQDIHDVLLNPDAIRPLLEVSL